MGTGSDISVYTASSRHHLDMTSDDVKPQKINKIFDKCNVANWLIFKYTKIPV